MTNYIKKLCYGILSNSQLHVLDRLHVYVVGFCKSKTAHGKVYMQDFTLKMEPCSTDNVYILK